MSELFTQTNKQKKLFRTEEDIVANIQTQFGMPHTGKDLLLDAKMGLNKDKSSRLDLEPDALSDTGMSDDVGAGDTSGILHDSAGGNKNTITGTNTPEEAARVLSEFFQKVVVKLDASGCLIQENGVQQVIPVIPEYVHQDSTGAGDAFLAGFLYGLYHDCSLAECVLYGNITGGKCVTAVGCLTAYCTEAELLEKAARYRSLLP